jgi:hypothetical protein
MKEMRNVYEILVANSEGRESLCRLSCRGEDNIKFDLKTTEYMWARFNWLRIQPNGGLVRM